MIFNYVVFTSTGEMVQAESLNAAQQLVASRFPHAEFGDWSDANGVQHLAVWSNAVEKAYYEFGATGDVCRPVAYVRVQEWKVAAPS